MMNAPRSIAWPEAGWATDLRLPYHPPRRGLGSQVYRHNNLTRSLGSALAYQGEVKNSVQNATILEVPENPPDRVVCDQRDKMC